ncbi:MAG: ADP-ribosylglycohydrolase family protein [Oscillospiraceae bacterium]
MTKHQAIPVLPVQDRIRGCLIGGAAGDALGYPVEFFSEQTLRERCGDGGIRQYLPDPVSGTARISDDTQMTLFTANGLLVGDTRMALRGIGAQPHDYVSRAYQDWLITQRTSAPARDTHASICWLMDIPALYRCRAPGSTCLSALTQQQGQPPRESYISHPQNHSKGCGGVMRVAPLGVSRYTAVPIEALDREGAELAAITHGHSLGYMPAAVLTHILHRIVYPEQAQTLLQIVREARDTVRALFAGDKHLDELTARIDLAIRLADNDEPDLANIHRLGEGWVAEETLAIAIYCALRHADDFSAGIISAVNHCGDSDSTGAVTGNILGALLGYDAIDKVWTRDLELRDVILELADDLDRRRECLQDRRNIDRDWTQKYVEGRAVRTI